MDTLSQFFFPLGVSKERCDFCGYLRNSYYVLGGEGTL